MLCQEMLYQEGEDTDTEFEGFEADDSHLLLRQAGDTERTLDDVRNWLKDNETGPLYQVLNDAEIAASRVEDERVKSSDDEQMENQQQKESAI
ncbi:hypothetical protein Pcinc_035321 [Petrolisthes cinctipes]|uniref:Uncharacterized protein n=1 Tax=Petrolisthes cinctipes TaxID=88211 RepID=A0AAE1ENV6_PETCI|nr:hypothetical protein Pcinc_035321 [Petrolisthes cinctipes]